MLLQYYSDQGESSDLLERSLSRRGEMSARPDIRQISLTSATGPPSGAPAPSSVTGPPGGPNGPASHPHHNIYAQRHPINQR